MFYRKRHYINEFVCFANQLHQFMLMKSNGVSRNVMYIWLLHYSYAWFIEIWCSKIHEKTWNVDVTVFCSCEKWHVLLSPVIYAKVFIFHINYLNVVFRGLLRSMCVNSSVIPLILQKFKRSLSWFLREGIINKSQYHKSKYGLVECMDDDTWVIT